MPKKESKESIDAKIDKLFNGSRPKGNRGGTHAVNLESGRVHRIVDRENDGVTLSVNNKHVRVTDERFSTIYRSIVVPPCVKAVNPDLSQSFERLVVSPGVVDDIRTGISRVLHWEEINKAWDLEKIGESAKTVLNFYGPSGTGKTMASLAIASELKRPLFQIDYSQLISPIVSASSGNISFVFKAASKANAILLFDEADSLTSTRLDVSASGPNAVIANEFNQTKNVFMQEIDKFDGVVIMTTNFFHNYDQAILRRIAIHVQFELPNKSMRITLFQKHIPNLDRCQGVDWGRVGEISRGLSGGDIKNVVLNSIYRVCEGLDPTTWFLTTRILEDEAIRLVQVKHNHQHHNQSHE